MATIDKRPLKAYVRFDGTGRIVPSSLILRRKMPKVGNWVEIPAYECCNPEPTSTTSTTTAVPFLRLLFSNIEEVDAIIGDSANVSDWNTYFDLPTLGTPFTSVEVIGNEVRLYGGSNIKIKPALMYDQGEFIIELDDQAGCITSVGGDAFTYSTSLTTVNLPECTIIYGSDDSPENDYGGFGACNLLTNISIPKLVTVGVYAFSNCTSILFIDFPQVTTIEPNGFGYCTSINSVNLPQLTTAGASSFEGCTDLTFVNLPQLTTVSGNQCFKSCTSLVSISLPQLSSSGTYLFQLCTSLTTISLPSCIDLGGSVGNNEVFTGINGNTISLTVPAALMTCNAGNPDGDIQYLQANNTVTIVTV